MSSISDLLETYEQQGYLVVADALEPGQVDAINAAIDEELARTGPFWIEREEGHVALNVHMLLAREEMDVSMRPPRLMPLLEAILGEDICAEEHSVRIRKPFAGDPYCHWHRDGGGWPNLAPRPPYHTHYVSVAFYLTDVDETTHTFSVLPGSAQSETLPPLEHYDLNEAHHIEGAKGTAVIFNAGMYHAGNVRQTDSERRTIHIYCGRASNPPISNYTIFPRRLWEGKDEAARRYYARPNAITHLLQERF